MPSLLVAPLIGSWSDKYGEEHIVTRICKLLGRKTPLIFTMVGYVLYTIFQLIATVTYEKVTIYQWYFLAELSMGLLSYGAKNTKPQD